MQAVTSGGSSFACGCPNPASFWLAHLRIFLPSAPCRLQGLLWVWMDPKSAAAAALRPLPLPTELQPTLGGSEASGVLLGDW